MKLILIFITLTILCCFTSATAKPLFILNKSKLISYNYRNDCVLLASPGRSGSTLLCNQIEVFAPHYLILKTHILPPDKTYRGKIVFIYSNPDKSAESALHYTIRNLKWGAIHFRNLESADRDWLNKLGNTTKQTSTNNVLIYDALGCFAQLDEWLLSKTTPSPKSPVDSQILAIKYEHLWEEETVLAIKEFLGLSNFSLPQKKERGYSLKELFPREILFRNLHNSGTWNEPIYHAYDNAREIWSRMPSFQYLELNE